MTVLHQETPACWDVEQLKDVGGLSRDGASRKEKLVPREAQPVYARAGMIVYDEDTLAIIDVVTPEFCIARTPNGELRALRWAEVELHHVRPDPRSLGAPASADQSTQSRTSELLQLAIDGSAIFARAKKLYAAMTNEGRETISTEKLKHALDEIGSGSGDLWITLALALDNDIDGTIGLPKNALVTIG